jgi:hypothetical protein
VGTYTNRVGVFANQRDLNMVNNSATMITTIMPPPSLAITHQGTNIVLSWPAAATGFVVEGTSTLLPPSWTTLSGATLVGDRFKLNVNTTTGTRYFRLKEQ